MTDHRRHQAAADAGRFLILALALVAALGLTLGVLALLGGCTARAQQDCDRAFQAAKATACAACSALPDRCPHHAGGSGGEAP